MAAINASTVFAITLAIIAGLICAWVFKTVFLAPKKLEPPKPVQTYRLTVMANNITENTKIQSTQVKRITVDKETFDKAKLEEKDKGEMLTGSQPIGRVPMRPLLAEKPIYEKDLLPLSYPKPLQIESGKVPVTVDVPTRAAAMARVGDRVDLLCTLVNTDPDLGPTETRTAVMARNVKVLARFNTTAEAARPTSAMIKSGLRPFTLEVTPWRAGLVELAKEIGGAFALRTHSKDDTGLATTVAAKTEETKDPDVDRVTTDDLVKLFGFTRPLPPRYFEIEKFSGVAQVQGAHIFLEPGSPQPGTRSTSQTPSRGQSGSSSGGLRGPKQQAPSSPKPAASGNRQASVTGNVDTHLAASGWRRVNVESTSSGGTMVASRGFGGLQSGGTSGIGPLSRAGGGLTGPPGTGSMGDTDRRDRSRTDCPNCGRKRFS